MTRDVEMTHDVRLMILFPYSAKSPEVFNKLAELLKSAAFEQFHTSKELPLLVVNVDSLEGYAEFWKNHSEVTEKYLKHMVWAVDTCQMWLAGWGRILDETPQVRGILQVPGDLTEIKSKDPYARDPWKAFLDCLTAMRRRLPETDLVVGDYEVAPEKAKQLIDTYGTFPLLYNWFPEVARKLREIPIDRPRS